MTSLGRIWTAILVCIAAGAPAASASDLVLACKNGDATLPVKSVAPSPWTLDDGGKAVAAPKKPDLLILGHLAEHPELCGLAPEYRIRRVTSEELHKHPEQAAVAEISLSYFQDKVYGGHHTFVNVCGEFLAERADGPALLLVAWLVGGEVRHVEKFRVDANGGVSVGAGIKLAADELQGQAVLLLWQDGRFLPAKPRFADAATQRAFQDCVFGDSVALGRELGAGVNPNAADARHLRLLHFAAQSGSADCVRALLKAGAKTQMKEDESNDAPLVWAAALGRTAAVDALLAGKADTEPFGDRGNTPLIAACKAGHLEVVQRLLAAGADVDQRNGITETPMSVSLDAGFAAVAEALLKKSPNFDFTAPQNRLALLTQVKLGHVGVVRLFLKEGGSAWEVVDGDTPIHEAARSGSAEMVRLLVESKADVNVKSPDGLTPLMVAAVSGNRDAVAELLAAGAKVSAASPRGGYTPLHFAAIRDRSDVVRLLVAAKAPVDAKSSAGVTALELALASRSGKSCEALVQAGARLDLASKAANQLLVAAVMLDQADLLAAEIKAGWKPEVPLADGWGALAISELVGAKRCTQVLRDAGVPESSGRPYPVVGGRELDAPLKVIRASEPVDPREDEDFFPAAKVEVVGFVDPSGRILFPEVRKARDARLVPAVLDTLSSWRLSPPTSGGKPVVARFALPLVFPSSSERGYAAAQVDELPKPIKQVPPHYPFSARRGGVMGQVVLEFVVSPSGHPEHIVVRRSSAMELCDPAIEAVKQWVFAPGKLKGKPVPVRMQMPIVFSLKEL